MKAQTHLAITAAGLLALLCFIQQKVVLSKYFAPRERNFSHSLTINFSNGKHCKGGTVLWITCRLFTIIVQWVHSHRLVITGLGIKSHHTLCSGPGIDTNFTGNLSRHFHYVLFSPSVKWIQMLSATSQDCWDDWCFDDGEIWVDVTRQAQSVFIIFYHQINPSV